MINAILLDVMRPLRHVQNQRFASKPVVKRISATMNNVLPMSFVAVAMVSASKFVQEKLVNKANVVPMVHV